MAGERQDEKPGALDLPRVFGLVVGACYVAGLLIVNIDLARHGVWDLQLARAQYVLVGALWIFLTVLAAAWIVLAMLIFNLLGYIIREPVHWTRAHVFIVRTATILALVGILEGLNYFALLRLPIQLLSRDNFSDWLVFAAFVNGLSVGFACLFSSPIMGRHFDLIWQSPLAGFIRRITSEPAALEGTLWTLPLGFILLLMGLGLYASGLFPYLSRTFGGGQPTLVRLVLNHGLYASWDHGVWVSTDGKRVGPVALLLEAGSTIFVSAVEEFDPAKSPSTAPRAVEISNSLVSLILRVPPRNDNDDVLIVGGRNEQQNALTSANVFRSQERKFMTTESDNHPQMEFGRILHTATRLPEDDTFILVAGGEDGAHHTLATIEAYQIYSSGRDTFMGFFSINTSMAVARKEHSATLLANNKILIVGGRDESGPLASAELFDRPTSTGGTYIPRFTLISCNLHTARARHSACALQDRIGPHAGEVLVCGGIDQSGVVLSTAELYDPVIGCFVPSGSMTTPRERHTATLLKDGRVLIVGGTKPEGILASAELYEPATCTFQPIKSMSMPREFHTATLLNDGRVIVIGGRGPEGPLNSAEIFDPVTNTFSPGGSMTTAREGHTATLLEDDTVLVAGGKDGNGRTLRSAELFDDWKETFERIADMKIPVDGAEAVILRKGTHH